MQISIKEQTIELLPQRAAFWVEKKILIVADIHLGKAAAMQIAGMAVPEGAMESDLQSLQALIESTQAEQCIVVGDLIHAKSGLSARVQAKFSTWLASIPCPIELIIGNHDRALIKQLPEGWNLDVHKEYLIIEPFCFAHFPKVLEPYFVWSGHIHPQYLIKGRHDHLTLRCFHISPNQGILPAFSEFVGGAHVKKDAGTQVYVIANDSLIIEI